MCKKFKGWRDALVRLKVTREFSLSNELDIKEFYRAICENASRIKKLEAQMTGIQSKKNIKLRETKR